MNFWRKLSVKQLRACILRLNLNIIVLQDHVQYLTKIPSKNFKNQGYIQI